MSGERTRTPAHFWIVGVLALLWNTMGAWDYVATQFKIQAYMSHFTAQQLDYFNSFPAWAVAGWAFGVWGAFVGSIALLLRKRCALWCFLVSIAGLVVTTLYNFGMSNGAEIMGAGGVIFSIVIWIVAVLLAVYAWRQRENGVLQ